jgi:hypothetical protein
VHVSNGSVENVASQVAGLAESAVLVPFGAALELGDRVVSVVRPWTSPNTAEKELNRVRRDVRRFERRGSTARNRLVRQVRTRRNRVTRVLRKRRTQMTRLVRGQRRQAERTVRQRTRQARVQVRRQQRQVSKTLQQQTRQTRERVQQYV